MSRTERIAELEASLVAQHLAVDEAVARLRGIEAELASLRAGAALKGEFASLARTDAILTVLRSANGTLSPTEILSSLHAAERTDGLRAVTATLHYLLGQGRIEKAGRGRYLAA
jgi:hypothetical protein